MTTEVANKPVLTLTEIKQMTPDEVREAFTDPETEAYTALATRFSTKIEDDLCWYYDLGKEVCRLLRKSGGRKATYGEYIVERMAIALGYATDTMLKAARRVVEVWSTKKAFSVVLKLRGENNNRLTWTHIVHLAAVPDEEARTELALMSLTNCFTAEELYCEIDKRFTSKANRGGGRPLRVPVTALGCLRHMRTTSGKIVKLFDQSWMGEQFSLREAASAAPVETLTKDVLPEVEQTRNVLADLQSRITAAQSLLQSVSVEIAEKTDGDGGAAQSE